MTLFSMQENKLSERSLVCEHCNSGDFAVSRCADCSVFMCEFCVTAHKRINAFVGHKMLSLAEVQKLGSKALVKPSFCLKHTGETLKLFCETCQKTICRDCTIVDHREHTYNFVTDVAEKERHSVEAILEDTKAKDGAVEEGLIAVQTMESRVKVKTNEVSRQVDVFFEEQVQALKYLHSNLKHELKTLEQAKLEKLGKQREMLNLSLVQLRNSVEFAERALEDGDNIALLSMKQDLIQRLTQLNSSQYQCKPCLTESLKLQVHQTISNIGKIATLSTQPTDPKKCTVSMVGGEEGVMYQTFVRQPVDFVLLTKDAKGNNETAGGLQVNVRVLCNYQGREYKEKHQNVVLHADDNGDGSYSFSFCAEAEGQVTMTVMLGNQDVCGSPFRWEVNPVLHIESGNLKSQLAMVSILPKCEQSVSVFTKGKHCWKVKLLSLNTNRGSEQEIAIGVSKKNPPDGHHYSIYSSVSRKWSWHYEATNQRSWRSDHKQTSITSVQDNDAFAVFLNFETNKLIIYNVRSRQAETFTHVAGGSMVPIISPHHPIEGVSSFLGPYFSLIQ